MAEILAVATHEFADKGLAGARIDEIAAVQQGLLESAFHALKPGGVLVYSTCTLSLQENQEVC